MLLLKQIRVSKQLQREVDFQKKFNQHWLDGWVADLQQKHQGTFSPDVLKKIRNYYGIYVPAVICNAYCILNGRDMTLEERQCATLFGILSPIYDDFFDEGTLSTEQLQAISFNPAGYQPATFEEKVFCDVQLWMLQHMAYPERYRETFRKVYESQKASLGQTDHTILEEALYKITYDKGYYAFLLYQDVLNIKHSEAYKQILYTYSGLLQLANDVFDVHKDLHGGIYTVPNLCRDFPAFKKRYYAEAKRFKQMVMDLDQPDSCKKDFLIIINYVVASGWIAILKLEKLLGSFPSKPDLKTLSRDLLICDMEKPANVLKRFHYSYRFSKMR